MIDITNQSTSKQESFLSKRKIKIFLYDKSAITNEPHQEIKLDENALILKDSVNISISDIKRIKVYRHPFEKTVGASGVLGLLIGLGLDGLENMTEYEEDKDHNNAFMGFLIGCAGGVVLSPIVLVLTRQNFVIDGDKNNLNKMEKFISNKLDIDSDW